MRSGYGDLAIGETGADLRGQLAERGGIILLHDIHEQTVIVLPHGLAELQARHMKTVVFVAAPTAAPSSPPWAR